MAMRLKVERVRRDLTQKTLSELTQGVIPQNRVSDLENGIRPKLVEAFILAGIFGLPPEELFAPAGD